MPVKERIALRFERRLRESDDGLGFWGWLAVGVASVTLLIILTGIVLSFDHADNIGTSLVGLAVGIVLIALLSPGWAVTVAVRRHRRRLGARQAAFMSRRDLADELFALGRIDDAMHRRQRQRLDPFLAGISAGDGARVASTWARIVGSLALMLALLAAGTAGGSTALDDADLQAAIVAGSTPIAVAAATLAVAMLAIAGGLSVRATDENRRQTEGIEAGHVEILHASRAAFAAPRGNVKPSPTTPRL